MIRILNKINTLENKKKLKSHFFKHFLIECLIKSIT